MNISFCGGAKEVGASCLLLQMDGRNVLLDSGIRLNSRDNLPDFRLIQEKGGIDDIVVGHAHRDHTGSLPVISREYPQVPLFQDKRRCCRANTQYVEAGCILPTTAVWAALSAISTVS